MPVQSTDPELASWLTQGKTILISLGTFYEYTQNLALEFATGLRLLLSAHPKLQILWKLNPSGPPSSKAAISETVTSILGAQIASKQVRLTTWLGPQPIDVLMGGNVVLSVHHGGANSFFEACYAGVPQVVLPQWYDTYDYAAKVEWLGVGVFGNKRCAPGIEGSEFAKALEKGLETGMAEKAVEVGKVCGRKEGRKEVAKMILERALQSSM
jgi:hypothetical protein